MARICGTASAICADDREHRGRRHRADRHLGQGRDEQADRARARRASRRRTAATSSARHSAVAERDRRRPRAASPAPCGNSSSPTMHPTSATANAAHEANTTMPTYFTTQQPGPRRPARPAGCAACRCRLARRSASPDDDRHRQRQEERQRHDQRGEHQEQPVLGDLADERRARRRRSGADSRTATPIRIGSSTARPAARCCGAGRSTSRSSDRNSRSDRRRRTARRGARRPRRLGRGQRRSLVDIEALPGQRHEQLLEVRPLHDQLPHVDAGARPARRDRSARHRRRARRPRRPARSVGRPVPEPRQHARRRRPAATSPPAPGRRAAARSSAQRALEDQPPWLITPTWVHICSISLSRCEDTNTVAPSAATSRTRCAPRGSPAGRGRSSARRARAAPAAAAARPARPSRWRIPSEYVAVALARGRGEPDPLQRGVDPAPRAAGAGTVRSAASSRSRLSRPDR